MPERFRGYIHNPENESKIWLEAGPPLDPDTFLTLLYVEIDDVFQREGPPEARRPGPQAALNRSEFIWSRAPWRCCTCWALWPSRFWR